MGFNSAFKGLMMMWEKIGDYSENNTQRTNRLCVQNTLFFNVKARYIYLPLVFKRPNSAKSSFHRKGQADGGWHHTAPETRQQKKESVTPLLKQSGNYTHHLKEQQETLNFDHRMYLCVSCDTLHLEQFSFFVTET